MRISTILVKHEDAEGFVEQLQTKRVRLSDPSGHDSIDWTDGPFLCEYPWRSTWSRRGWDAFEEGFRGVADLRYVRPIIRHVWESHLDASLSEGLRFCLPQPWIARGMGLRPSLSRPGELVDERNGQIVFVDPGRGTPHGAALVREERFFEFLEQQGLECLWIVAGKRNAWPSGQHGDFVCRSFSSVYRREGGAWIGRRWHEDQVSRSDAR